VKLHVEEWGDPSLPTLVCVHGVTGHGRRFAPLADAGLAHRFHLVAPDLRGHGRSGWEPPWSLEQHVDDLLESVTDDACLWVGHSFGGRLVLEIAVSHPGRVERAVLLDPALWVPPPIALEEADAFLTEASFASVDEAVDRRLASGLDVAPVRALLVDDFAAHLEPGADGRLRFRFSRASVIAAYGEMARTPPLVALTRPVSVVRATGSRVCPAELVAAIAETAGPLLTSVELDAGHTVIWDAPEETAALIGRLLAAEVP